MCERHGRPVWGQFPTVMPRPENLLKADLWRDGWTDYGALGQIRLQRAMEAALFGPPK